MPRRDLADIEPEDIHPTISRPQIFLWRMLVFLILIGFLVVILINPAKQAFLANPGLNGLILGVLAIGILYAFRQVIRLYPEIRWVNGFRIADPGLSPEGRPSLLAPMANMLRDRRGQLSLSAASMRSIMDSIAARLDEARDTGRYLVGLLIFLGLLGTFWGLLDTISSVGNTISSLSTSGSDTAIVFEELKRGLEAPLKGMGTAFSSSLFGLAGSLILGFLDLQANHAQNRFYNELEEWLADLTEIGPGEAGTHAIPAQIRFALIDMQRAMVDLGQRIQASAGVRDNARDKETAEAIKQLAQGIEKLVRQMRAEQKVVREWVDEQAAQQSELSAVLRDLNANINGRGR